MNDTWREPARDLPVVGRPDVLVVGGGSAGIAAAVAAARRGADTWLVERGSWVGGLATLGLVNLLLTLDDGAGHQVVAGLCQEFVDRMAVSGDAVHPDATEWNDDDAARVDAWRSWGLVWGAPPEAVRYSVAFEPDAFIDVAYELLQASGVTVRLHTWCADVGLVDGNVTAVVIESKAGRQVIMPRMVIDASGDADVAVAAGIPHDRVTIPPHLWFRVGGVDPGAPLGLYGFRTVHDGRVLVPWGPHTDRVDACDPVALTRSELACRAAARDHLARLRQEVPGWEHAWLDDYARMLGITESRRIVGDHVLAKEDGDVHFSDSVACTGHWTRRDIRFEIPLRSLKQEALANVLVAGRCISTTRYVHQATKEIPAAMATGEAAGVAAVHALDAGSVHAFDVARLRLDLRRSGAVVEAPC